METGRIEFDDPTFRAAKTEMLKTTKAFDIVGAFEAGFLAKTKPIDMILPCPACGTLHVDAPEPDCSCGHHIYPHHEKDDPDSPGPCTLCECPKFNAVWDNPPHKTHLCHGCGIKWRPADVPTNGVAEIKTRGENDTWPGR